MRPARPIDPTDRDRRRVRDVPRNPLSHRDRRLGESPRAWVRSFACDDMKVLIVCRGPIRKEAIDVFREMGMTQRRHAALGEGLHRLPARARRPSCASWTRSTCTRCPTTPARPRRSASQRIRADHRDLPRPRLRRTSSPATASWPRTPSFVRALEEAGLTFIGPGSYTQMARRREGRGQAHRDRERRCRSRRASTTSPCARCCASTRTAPRSRSSRRSTGSSVRRSPTRPVPLAELAEQLLEAGYAKRIDLFTIDELARRCGSRPSACSPSTRDGASASRRSAAAAARDSASSRDAAEVAGAGARGPARGEGDRRRRQQEHADRAQHRADAPQRDPDHRQRRLVHLARRPRLLAADARAEAGRGLGHAGGPARRDRARARRRAGRRRPSALRGDLGVLERMEAEAERFGRAVELDSASTFECIVEGDRHYFMEVNTRIQVEHRVSELCYALRFTNPDDPTDAFDVHSLVEAMALIARHKERLPKPSACPRDGAAIEVRLNATDRALSPAAGGVIMSWSRPDRAARSATIRASASRTPTPGSSCATAWPAPTTRTSRCCSRPARTARELDAAGRDPAPHDASAASTSPPTSSSTTACSTGSSAATPWAKPTTKFVVPYLTLVGELAQEAHAIDLDYAFQQIARRATRGGRARARSTPRGRCSTSRRRCSSGRSACSSRSRTSSRRGCSQHRLDFVVARRTRRVAAQPGRGARRDLPAAATWTTPDGAAAHASGITTASCSTPRSPSTRSSARACRRAWRGRSSTRAARRRARVRPRRGAVGDACAPRTPATSSASRSSALLPLIADKVGFYDLRARATTSTVRIPERLHDPEHQEAMRKVLVPPPATQRRRDRRGDGRHVLRAGGAATCRPSSTRAPTSTRAIRSTSSRS